ncbi:MAG: DUF3108 domain-containing protein [Kiritimatiellaeota bacterium]|nr:DUF3108 domain-containing protein [Kiritimatiellota bacterium]
MLCRMYREVRAWLAVLGGLSCAAVWGAGPGGPAARGATETRAAPAATKAAAPAATNAPALMNAAALPFPVGEAISYRIYWGIIPVGQARVVFERVEENGRPLLAIRSTARTNRVLEKFYPVNDLLESLIDPATFLPVRFTKKISEGRYWTHEITTFDHARRMAHFESKKSGAKSDYAIDADTRDILTMMYFLRTRPFVAGTQPVYRVVADEKMYDFSIDIQKNEKVKTEHYGTVATVKVEPKAAFQGLFIRKGRAWFWISRDPRQLAVKMAAQVPVASITLELDEVSGPGQDFWIKPAPAGPPAQPQTEGRHDDQK